MKVNDISESAMTHERAAVIRLIKAHVADCERRGIRLMAAGYLALVSEIEDAMHHDSAHVEGLEGPPLVYCYRGRNCINRSWHVGGEDTNPDGGGAGVLEWCDNEADAKERMGIMARYPQFKGLTIGKWED